VPSLLDGLTDAQREAVTHAGGPLAIAGGPGTGKTHCVLARFAWLVERGGPPERLLLLAGSPPAADSLRARLEATIQRPYEELAVTTFEGFCARLLRDEALAAGLDPFAATMTPADRLALLLERMDELPLRRHDFQGNPAALLASFIERFDLLKQELVSAEDYERWAAGLADEDERAEREREFAAVYAAHDRLLREAGTLDSGELVVLARRLLREDADVRARVCARLASVIVDDVHDATRAQVALLELLAGPDGDLVVAGDGATWPGGAVVRLEHSLRCPQRILDAAGRGGEVTGRADGEVSAWRCANERAQAQSVAADVERLITREGVEPEAVCVLVRSVRREGQAVAVALEERGVPYRVVGAAAFFQRAEIRDVLAWLRLLADPGDAGAVVRALARPPIELRSVDIARCTQISRRRKIDMVSALVAATESPQIPPEARDRILVFLKLYRSASAALDTTRPDLYVHRLIERLGLRRQQLFAAQADVVERLLNLARFGELATAYVRRSPQATPREFARYIAAVAEAGLREEEAMAETEPRAVQVMAMRSARGLEFEHVYVLGLHSSRMPGARTAALEPIPAELLGADRPPDDRDAHVAAMRRLLGIAMTRARERLVLAYPERGEKGQLLQPSPFLEEATAAAGLEWEEREEELFGPAESLHATFRMMRDELLDTVSRTGGRLSELRFDTDLDVSHAVVRYLELLKLSALLARPDDQDVADALPEINARLARAVTAEQREIFQTSVLDEYLLDAERDARRRAAATTAREEPSLEAFLPRRGEGLALSASDVETYRICPLRYKFARVFRIPQEPTLNQRFGILVHQVLERFHAGGGTHTLAELLGLLDAGWRRGGFGDSDEERQLREKATHALMRYFRRFQTEEAEPVWFERPFSFRLGPHLVSGRVDRVDRLPDGSYELIDYKTGRPKTGPQLREDVQLSLYAVGAREAWELDAVHQAYWYVLDDEKVPVARDEADRDWITETVMEVAEAILAQGFEPTPSYSACSTCDFRIICPAAEK
jgi:superfamily I DNA/RNA helicase/RecB family exonuclease